MVAVPVLAGALLRMVNGVAGRPHRPEADRRHRPGRRPRRPPGRMVVRHRQLRAGAAARRRARRRPARPSRWRCRWPRAGIRRSIQGIALGIAGAGNSGTVFAALFAPGLAAAYRLEQRVRPRRHPARHRLRRLPRARQGQPRARRRRSRCRSTCGAPRSATPGGSCSSTRHLRRLRRPRLVAHHLLQRPVRAEPGDGRLLHRRLRLRRLAGAPGRRRARRPDRRHPDALDHVHRGGRRAGHRQLRPAAGLDGAAGLRRRHAGARHGQRRGVPARAAALPASRSA